MIIFNLNVIYFIIRLLQIQNIKMTNTNYDFDFLIKIILILIYFLFFWNNSSSFSSKEQASRFSIEKKNWKRKKNSFLLQITPGNSQNIGKIPFPTY
jgi:hypothetical protein